MPAEEKGEEGTEEAGAQEHIAHSAVDIKVLNFFKKHALNWFYLG